MVGRQCSCCVPTQCLEMGKTASAMDCLIPNREGSTQATPVKSRLIIPRGFARRSGAAFRLSWFAACHGAGLAQCGANSSANAHEHARAKTAAREGARDTVTRRD